MVLLVGAGLLLNGFLRLRAVDPGPDPDRTLTLQVFPSTPRPGRGEEVARVLRAAGGARGGAAGSGGCRRRAGAAARGSAGIRLSVHDRGPHRRRAEELSLPQLRGGHPALLREHRAARPARPRVHRGRPRRGAAGGDPGGVGRAALLGRRRSRRQADQVGRARRARALAGSGRGGGGRPLPRAREREPRRVRPLRAEPLAAQPSRHPHHCRSGVAAAGPPPRGLGAGAERAAARRRHRGRDGVGGARSAALHHHAPGHLRDLRAPAGRGRARRGALVHDPGAHPRDRYPHGARRERGADPDGGAAGGRWDSRWLGSSVGAGLAAALARLVRGLLFEVGPHDLPTYAAVAGVLAMVALLAALLPAWRASRQDAVVALRSD